MLLKRIMCFIPYSTTRTKYENVDTVIMNVLHNELCLVVNNKNDVPRCHRLGPTKKKQ